MFYITCKHTSIGLTIDVVEALSGSSLASMGISIENKLFGFSSTNDCISIKKNHKE